MVQKTFGKGAKQDNPYHLGIKILLDIPYTKIIITLQII